MILRVENISKEYRGKKVLNVDQLEIQANDVLGIVGNNGAGKTTMLSIMLDLIIPTSGRILSKGNEVQGTEDWKEYTTAFLDESFLINFLTPDEYFAFIGEIYHWNQTDVNQFLLQFAEFFNGEILGVRKYIRDLSKGNQKKVGLIAALIGNSEIVLLDEPFSNLDPTSQIRFKNIITEHSGGKTFLISSHDLNHITEICNRIVILENGILVHDLEKSDETLGELGSYFSI